MIKPTELAAAINSDAGVCPICELDFTPRDGDFVIRLYSNGHGQWVNVAYHQQCYDERAAMFGPSSRATDTG